MLKFLTIFLQYWQFLTLWQFFAFVTISKFFDEYDHFWKFWQFDYLWQLWQFLIVLTILIIMTKQSYWLLTMLKFLTIFFTMLTIFDPLTIFSFSDNFEIFWRIWQFLKNLTIWLSSTIMTIFDSFDNFDHNDKYNPIDLWHDMTLHFTMCTAQCALHILPR